MLKISSFKKKWLSFKNPNEQGQDHLEFVGKWVDELEIALRRAKYDKEFTGDIIGSAYKFYLDELNDDQKADAFAYLLGKFIRKL